MSILSLWHAGVTVSDLDRSVTFYSEVLGLRERIRQVQDNEYTRRMLGYADCRIEVAQLVADGPHGVSGHLIELVQFLQPEAITDPGPMHRLSTVHIALAIESLEGVYERVIAAGGTPVTEPVDIVEGVNTGGKAMWFRDPDGVLVELVQPPRDDPSSAE